MADDQDNANQSGIPAWQRESSNATPAPATSSDQSDDKLTVARRFLEDEEVRTASREKKVAFLKAKGIEDGDIEILVSWNPAILGFWQTGILGEWDTGIL